MDQNFMGLDAAVEPTAAEMNEPVGDHIPREAPDPAPARRALVSKWNDRVVRARQYWTDKAFRRMQEDMRFAAGQQWPQNSAAAKDARMFMDAEEQRYVANIVLRHVSSRTAAIYGKNPKIVARVKERLLSSVWDGSAMALQAAMQALTMNPMDPMAAAVMQDAMQVQQQKQQLDRMGKTLQLQFEHEIDEQPLPFKVQMKATVRRALTTGVGYVKLGYQRVMETAPDVEAEMDAAQRQLDTLERLAADRADGVTQEDDAKMEQLRLTLTELSVAKPIIVREGLTFGYPHSTALIFDTSIQQLRGFVGAGWVAEEYFLTGDRVKEIYGVDVSSAANSMDTDGPRPKLYERTLHNSYTYADRGQSTDAGDAYFCVWEVYNREDGLVYVMCDGYADFLREPAAPDVKLERFFPWFPFAVNEVYDDDTVIPPSDVRLMWDMQMELNRARQGLREHRRAARPKTFTRRAALSEDDKASLQSASAHAVIELDGMQTGDKVEDILQPFSGPEINPALYDPSPVFEDYLRTLGQQEAQLGGTSGATATETAIAEGARASGVSSVVDDLDEFLSELARAAGQVLLTECSAERVKATVGPGAVWPEFSAAEIAQELYLDIEAASTGRPNKAAEIQNANMIFPMLMQIPGLSPEWLAKEMLRRLDDKLDLTDAFLAGSPSIQMLNRSAPGGPGAAPGAAPPGSDPAAQGPEGAQNAPGTEPPQVNAAPRPGSDETFPTQAPTVA